MIDWSSLLENYGYFAVIVGTFFEGETILLLGAYAVQQNMFNFWFLILSAMIGGFIGDQFYYQIGTKFGHDFIARRPKLAKKFQEASQWIDTYPILSILFMRFAWGLRTVIPISFGIKKYPLFFYMMVNIVASFIWAFVVVSVGLQVTHWVHQFWEYLIHGKEDLLIVFFSAISILIIGILYGLFFRIKNKT